MSKLSIIQEEQPPVADIFIGSNCFKTVQGIAIDTVCGAMERCLSYANVEYVFAPFSYRCKLPHFTVMVNIYRSPDAEETFVIEVKRGDENGGFGTNEFARSLKFLLTQEKIVPLPVILTPEEAIAKKRETQKAWLAKAKAMMARKEAVQV